MKYPHNKKRLQELAGVKMNEAAVSSKLRQQVAKELSELQRLGVLSVKTDAVRGTLKGEFDSIIRDSLNVRDAVDAIVDLFN